MDNTPKKVFIYCQAGAVTGGIELLHQLCDVLNNNHRSAYIVYTGHADRTIPSEYSCYNIKTTEDIEDSPQNTVVIFEAQSSMPQVLKTIRHARIVLWWLSVDNYYKGCMRFISIGDLYRWNKRQAIERFFSRLSKTMCGKGNKFCGNLNFKTNLADSRIFHAYQSEYARTFLLKQGLKNIVPLMDFINTDHLTLHTDFERQDRVLYNPAKGIEFTSRLIKAAPQINWVPIQNMTRVQVVALMRSSKLYIDFGNHPGKDRMPRECALNGCCVITGRRGAANFSQDTAINDSYKFDQRRTPISTIIDRIKDVLENYEERNKDFDSYRAKTMGEKAEFEKQALDLFY